MKSIYVAALGLFLAASPAFAATQVLQETSNNATGEAVANSRSDAGNGGVAASNVSNSAGILNQNINTGATSNVGTATDLLISGGVTSNSDGLSAGSSHDRNDQLATAQLAQISTGNVTGVSAECATTSVYNNGVNNVSVNGSRGIVTQQINTGVSSNIGSAVGVTIH